MLAQLEDICTWTAITAIVYTSFHSISKLDAKHLPYKVKCWQRIYIGGLADFIVVGRHCYLLL